jgi:aminoglycoside phosphotransferase (APT) family kinase protein
MDAVALLVELGLIAPGERAEVESLTGGVSSDICLVRTDSGDYCVKFALAQLKVAAVWTAPVRRNAAEYEWLRYAAGIVPEAVPELFGRSERLNGFVMAYLDPDLHPVWKAELLAGRVDVPFAGEVGRALGAIHRAAAADARARARFPNLEDFRALRLEPYFAYTAQKHPDLAEQFARLSEGQERAKISLVHGDVSPKNILIGPKGPVFLDAECAVEGDPAFDIAFCLNHLAIKALAQKADPALLALSAAGLWETYAAQVDWEPAEALEARVAALLPALILARVDGKSPVEYLDDAQRDRQRAVAKDLFARAPRRIGDIFEVMKETAR